MHQGNRSGAGARSVQSAVGGRKTFVFQLRIQIWKVRVWPCCHFCRLVRCRHLHIHACSRIVKTEHETQILGVLRKSVLSVSTQRFTYFWIEDRDLATSRDDEATLTGHTIPAISIRKRFP